MPIAIKKDFHVKKGVEAPSLKLGTQEVTSLLDSASTSAIIKSPPVAKQIMNVGGATSKIYDSADLLPAAGNDSGDFAYVYTTNRLYLWNGSGWYNIALINTAPGLSGPDSSYSLTSALNSNTITALQVTLTATDPEGLPITFSAVGSDSASRFIDITQDSSVTTITPKNRTALALGDSNGGGFSVTFKATDGTFIAPFVSSFTLQFPESFALFALTEVQKLQSNDIGAGDNFGQDVALSDKANYAIVGAWKEDEAASDAGAAYIFTRSENSLIQQAKLTAGDGTSSDSFGYSVDINKTGTHAIVGAKGADPSSAGGAYIYKRTGTSWEQIGKVNNTSSPSSGDWYGVSVAISNSGDRVVVGSHNKSSGTGAAYVYKESTGTYDVTNVPGNFISASNALNSQNSTQRDIAFNANGTKMFILGSGGTPSVYQYSLSTAYNTSTWTYDSVSFAVNTQITAPAGLHFNTDGTKMYISGQSGASGQPTNGVWQYTLSTGFNLSTASYSNVNLSTATQDSSTHGLTMNPNGTKLVIAGNNGNRVYGYDLSTAFDLSTASFASQDYGVGSQESTPQDVIFNGDGTKMMVTGSQSDDVHVYTLSTAYNVSSASFSQTVNYGNSYSWANLGAINSPTGMQFNPDGTKFYIIDSGRNRVYQFSALAGYDLEQELVRSPSSTSHYYGYSVDMDDDGDTVVIGSYGNSKAYVWTRSGTTWTQQVQLAGSQTANASEWFGRSVSISEDGLTVLVGAEKEGHSGTTRPGAGYIFKYGTANYQVENATHDHSSPAISQDTQPSACLFNSDGTKVFVFGYQNDKIYQYNLSTAYDVSSSSMSYVSGSDITLSDFSGDPSGARWNNDGTKLFIIDKTNDRLHQYTLSTAYDLSTLSYDGYASVSQATVAFGFDFNSDGTKVFVVDRSNDRIYQYSMTTAYDYSTLTYDNVYTSTTDGNTDPFSVAFNSTGTRYFVTDDDSTARIHIYECAIPYDLSDTEHVGTFAVNSQELYPKQITFSPSGDKMFLVGNDADKIQRYDVQTTNSWYQEARLQQAYAGYQDWMGSKASISGDGTVAALGASYAQNASGTDAFGQVMIFTRSASGLWSEGAQRQASDLEYNDRFGLGVGISPDGRYLLVGAPYEDTNGSDAGKAYFYKAPQNQFTFPWSTGVQEARILGEAASEYFGYSVGLDQYADRAIMGAQYANYGGQNYTGAAYIYTRSGTSWSKEARIGPSDGSNGDRFGTSVALSLNGTTAAVGAYLEDPDNRSNAGSVYVYDKPSTYDGTSWGNNQAWDMTSIGQTRESNDRLGYSVDIDGDYLIAGMPYGGPSVSGSNGAGTAAIFVKTGGTYAFQTELTGQWNDGSMAGGGRAVAISGTRVYVGVPNYDSRKGRVAVYTRSGTTWTHQANITGAANESFLGCSLMASGDTVIIGESGNDTGGSNRGRAYIYTGNNTLEATLTASDAMNSANFGFSVAIHGDLAVVGAYGHDSSKGQAYVFERSGTTWTEKAILTAFSGGVSNYGSATDNNQFGWVVDCFEGTSTNTIVVSARTTDNKGYVYVFEGSGTSYSGKHRIQASDVAANDYFGCGAGDCGALRIDKTPANNGDYIAVGAYQNDENSQSNSGTVYIFKRSSTTFDPYISGGRAWTEMKKLHQFGNFTTYAEGATNSAYLGYALAIQNTNLVVGAYGYSQASSNAGALYSYNGLAWSQTAKTFSSSGTSQYYGQSVDLNSDGTIMAVGAPYESFEYSQSGAVYVMKKEINYQVMNMSHVGFTSVNSANNDTTDIAFNNDGTKLYHTGVNTDRVVEYDLSTAYDVSTRTYNDVNFLPSAGGYNTGIRWKPDGTKIFVLSHTNNGGGTATVHRYGLSTPFDLSTVNATAEQTYDARGQLNRAWGFTFKPDGTKMFITDDNGNDINEFSLSTAWDLTTGSYVTNFSISSQESQPSGLEFNADGKILYMSGFNNDRIYKYNLSTAYDISTMGYSSEYISVSGQSSQPGGIKFQPDGSKLFLACISSNGVDTYDTSGIGYNQASKPSKAALHSAGQSTTNSSQMGWDIAMNSSATRIIAGAYRDTQSGSNAGAAYIFTGDGTGSFTAERKIRPPTSPSPSNSYFGRSVDITEDGNTVVIGSISDNQAASSGGSATIYNRLPPEYYGAMDFQHISFYSLTDTGVSNVTDIAWNSDGTKLFSIAYSGDKVNEYSVSTAYDVSTKTYVRQFDLSGQTNYPTGITFNTDGTKMFITHPTGIGGGTNGLFQYNLTTGFDLSTASYANIALSRDSYTNDRAWGVSFKPDGTKMFISDDGGDDIRQFTLSTPFDLSTISSYDSSTDLYVGSQDNETRGHAFNGDGTKLFVVGNQHDRLYSYNLTTAYDLSTASYDTYKTLSSQSNNPSGIKFNNDGSKMYISCIQSEGVDEYNTLNQDWDSGYKIFHPTPYNTDYFGVSVSISGDGKTVAIGCERDDDNGSDSGTILVYHRGEEGPTNNGTGSNYLNGNGTSVAYHYVKTLLPSDLTANDKFTSGQDRAQGLEMSKNGQYIIGGAFRADPNSLSDAGEVYIFRNV